MNRATWAAPSFQGRGARTPHLIVGDGRRTACGTRLGYGNLSYPDPAHLLRPCKRCAAHAAKADK